MSESDRRLYIGTKMIWAQPMTKEQYCGSRGWQVPEDEDGNETGFQVQYPDGYISWSPLQQFNEAYRLTDDMNFGLAIEAMKRGYKVAREGWNGKDMFLYFVPGSKFNVNRAPLLGIFPEGTEVDYGDHIDIRKADGTFGTWSPSNSDALADDWQIID